MKTGVLVHGYNVNSENWQEVVWWKNPKLIGRLPQAAKVIAQMEPELVIFGTGASEKDGKIEAEIMRDYLLEYFTELAILPDFLGVNIEKLRERIAKISRLEIKSKNTFEEIEYASRMFKEAGIEVFGSVSSPDHARCAAYADQIFTEDKELTVFKGNYFTWLSQVPYGEKGKWPLVVESPNRLYPVFQKIMALPREQQEKIIKKALG